MLRLRLSTFLISATISASALPLAGPSAFAQIVIPTNRNALIQQNELQQLQNQIQRQQYQQQQQLYREQDRQIAPKARPDVPVFDRTCRLEAVGNTISRVCR